MKASVAVNVLKNARKCKRILVHVVITNFEHNLKALPFTFSPFLEHNFESNFLLFLFSPFLEHNFDSSIAVFTLQNINFTVTNIQKEGGLQVP